MDTQDRNSYEKETDSTKDFIIGAIVGGIVGAAAALFLAPRSGKELRNEIQGQTSALKDKSLELSNKAKLKSNEVAETAKSKTISLTQTVSKQSTEIMNRVKDITKNTNQVAEDDSDGPRPIVSNDEIQKKLQETQKAFDETESKLNH